jgi:hypothetical protein
MIYPVIFTIHGNPVIFIQSFRVIKIIDNRICYPAIIGNLIFINPEFNNGIIAGITIGNLQSIYNDNFSSDG